MQANISTLLQLTIHQFIREESGANTEEKELPLSPEEGSATPYLVGDEDERNDSYDEEDERSASCAFFLDNEGFIVTKVYDIYHMLNCVL